MKKAENFNEAQKPNLRLDDVFSLFFGTDTLRPAMHSPFEINGKVYATDAFSLVRCDKSDCDFEISNLHTPPNCEAIMPTPNTNIILSIDKSVFEQYKTKDELKYTGEDVECATCNGFGDVDWEFGHYTKTGDCPDCDGSGLEVEKRSVKTGNKTFGNFWVKLNETYFRMNIFYKLIQAQEALGGDITLIYQSKPTCGVLFKVGFCEILLLPCILHDVDDTEGVLNIA